MVPIFPEEVNQVRPMGDEPSGRGASVAAIVATLAQGKSPIIAVHSAKSMRTRLLDDLIPALGRQNFRVVPVRSLDGVRIDLGSLMDQVIGHGCVDVIERSERCHAALTAPGAEQAVLIVDDAQLLADQALRYLDLVTSIGRLTVTPPHIVLLGSPELWECLPTVGNLAADKAALCIAIRDESAEAEAGGDGLPFDTFGTDPAMADVACEEGPAVVEATELAVDEVKASEVTTPNDVGVADRGASAVHDDAADDVDAVVVSPQSMLVDQFATASGSFDTLCRASDAGSQAKVPVDARPEQTKVSAPAKRRWGVLVASVGFIVVGGGLAADRVGLIRTRLFDQGRGTDTLVVAQPATEGTPQAGDLSMSAGANAAEPPKMRSQEDVSGARVSSAGDTSPAQATPASGEDRSNAAAAADTADHAASVTAFAASTAAQAETNQREPAPPPAPPAVVASSTEPPPSVTVSKPPSDAGNSAAVQPTPSAAAAVPRPESVVPASSDTAGSSAAAHAAPPAKASVDAPALVPPGVVTLLITRGDALLATGDVSAARLMYQRAAQSGSAQGAVGLGKTYDTVFLAQISARGIAADPNQARVWYQRAADLGSPEATRRLAELQAK